MRVLTTLNGYVLLRPCHVTQTLQGIDIPDSVDKEKPTIGEIVMGCEYDPLKREGEDYVRVAFEPGTIVSFGGLAHRKIMHDGEECLLVSSEDIYAILEA